ncbi:hypothetical protein GW930_01765 [Candidatus Saccharibacteria bacterium]|nr:hypothetical protein [Candidatus Saccharibacteria bacterium]
MSEIETFTPLERPDPSEGNPFVKPAQQELPTQHDRETEMATRLVRKGRLAYEKRPVSPRSEKYIDQDPPKKYTPMQKAVTAGIGLVLGAGIGTAGKEAYHGIAEKFEHEIVAEGIAVVDQDSTVINAVNETIAALAAEEDIPRELIPSAVTESQEAQSELFATTGERYVQPGTGFKVEISENDFNYSVNVSPIITNSPDVPETETA